MKILVHIGLPLCGNAAVQAALADSRAALLAQGVLVPEALGRKNHARLYMAVSDPDNVDPLRAARGYALPEAQERLRQSVEQDLRDAASDAPDARLMVLSASQLASLSNRSELERLKALLSAVSDDIAIVAHVDDQARLLLRHYAETLRDGRTAPLQRDLAEESALDWLDHAAMAQRWEGVFGPGALRLRCYDPDRFGPAGILDELRDMLGLARPLDPTEGLAPVEPLPSAATLTRWRLLNGVLERLAFKGRTIPPDLRKRLIEEVAIPGPAPDAGSLSAVSGRFRNGNAALLLANPGLTCLTPDPASTPWEEADPGFGFRATQYAAAFLPRIDKASRQTEAEALAEPAADSAPPEPEPAAPPGPEAVSKVDPWEQMKVNLAGLRKSRLAPHNRIGTTDETSPAPPYRETQPRNLGSVTSGNVIVGCMKNEAPYILEWVAYHRQIGVDNFLIYTNDCSDGTDAVLNRMQELGYVQHRNNDTWKGKSPQQHALNNALDEDLVRNADWTIHIDVDEFINVRTGNGTLDDFLALVPDATNVAMTWRLFGHNGVTRYDDRLVISQFDHAAPKFCPKPHTAWGFKTMTRNVGAYAKLSCHRPTKLDAARSQTLRWVNGSGQPMPDAYHDKGWRSDRRSVGYDLLQLNHYALRSAESFLVKRQRGRALHVDRSIGLNYWIRMDWNDHRDITIQRNIPRVQAEVDRMLSDPELRRLHGEGVAWHKAKAAELHALPEFSELYRQALDTRLTEMERVALAMALDI